jgi:hypothetical protein
VFSISHAHCTNKSRNNSSLKKCIFIYVLSLIERVLFNLFSINLLKSPLTQSTQPRSHLTSGSLLQREHLLEFYNLWPFLKAPFCRSKDKFIFLLWLFHKKSQKIQTRNHSWDFYGGIFREFYTGTFSQARLFLGA